MSSSLIAQRTDSLKKGPGVSITRMALKNIGITVKNINLAR